MAKQKENTLKNIEEYKPLNIFTWADEVYSFLGCFLKEENDNPSYRDFVKPCGVIDTERKNKLKFSLNHDHEKGKEILKRIKGNFFVNVGTGDIGDPYQIQGFISNLCFDENTITLEDRHSDFNGNERNLVTYNLEDIEYVIFNVGNDFDNSVYQRGFIRRIEWLMSSSGSSFQTVFEENLYNLYNILNRTLVSLSLDVGIKFKNSISILKFNSVLDFGQSNLPDCLMFIRYLLSGFSFGNTNLYGDLKSYFDLGYIYKNVDKTFLNLTRNKDYFESLINLNKDKDSQ